MRDTDSQLLEEALSKVYTKESLDPARENRFSTYNAWRRAAKAAGAVRQDGDKDIATAFDGESRAVGEWDGASGILYKKSDSVNESTFTKGGVSYTLGHKINKDEPDHQLHEYWLTGDGGKIIDLTDSRQPLSSGEIAAIAKEKGFSKA